MFQTKAACRVSTSFYRTDLSHCHCQTDSCHNNKYSSDAKHCILIYLLSAAPLASGLNLYYFLILLLVFLGIDTSPAQPRNVVRGLPGDALGLRLITGYQVAICETVTCVVAS